MFIDNMKREVLGADLIQGKDYVLTIAGQIKGIGHPSLDPQKDPGLDGATSGANIHVAKDALGMAFGYYAGDFNRSYSGNQSPYNASESTLLAPGSDLFSGFIGSYALKQQTMTVPPGQTLLKNGDLVGERFVYDRIGRIRSGTTQKRNGSAWEAETNSGYTGTYVYDQNGTMRRFTRRAMTDPVTSVFLDDVTISMNSASSNVVDVVSEAASGIAGYNADVKNQTTGQTATDAKGQQTQNIGMNEARATEWRSDGDVKRVTTPSAVLTHAYDAFGRIVRTRSSTEDKTWYRIHGTSMDEALYTKTGANTPAIQEWTLYGLGRVGVDRMTSNPSSGDIHYRIIGSKLYEMNDHLGSVRGLVTDIKIPDGSGRFNAEEVEVRDYDPYGQERPNRAVTALTNLYGYAYHGMRKQIEGGWVNDYGTLFRPYEGGLGRWSSQDPVMRSWMSPYQGMGLNPLSLVDPLGLNEITSGGSSGASGSTSFGGGLGGAIGASMLSMLIMQTPMNGQGEMAKDARPQQTQGREPIRLNPSILRQLQEEENRRMAEKHRKQEQGDKQFQSRQDQDNLLPTAPDVAVRTTQIGDVALGTLDAVLESMISELGALTVENVAPKSVDYGTRYKLMQDVGTRITELKTAQTALAKIGKASTLVSVAVVAYNVVRIGEIFTKGYVELKVGKETVLLPIVEEEGQIIASQEIAKTTKDVALLTYGISTVIRRNPWGYLGLLVIDMIWGDDLVDAIVRSMLTPHDRGYPTQRGPGDRDKTRVESRYMDR